jgi:protein-disulfide isomerase
MKASFVIPGAIICAGVILAGAVYASFKGANPSAASQAASAAAAISADDHILGNPTAKVKIVEYSDFDCPHCATFNATLHQLVNDYGTGGDVAWIFRNFAITELHPNAKKHAEAAECVAQTAGNEAYFKFNDLLFANQPADPTKYAEYARATGASPEAVASCIQNAATNGIDARIDAERQNAIDAGAGGTPYSLILIDGKPPIVIDGAWSYADLKDQLDAALAASK